MALSRQRRPQPRKHLAGSSQGVTDEPTRRALLELEATVIDLQQRVARLEAE